MKVKIFPQLNFKIYLLSVILGTACIFFSAPAFSQIDFYYGLSRTGFRASVGGGVSNLYPSYWGVSSPGPAGTVAVDYDFSQFFSVGFQSQFGTMAARDSKDRFTPGGTKVTFVSGMLNIRVAVGAIANYDSKNALQDVLKRIYLGSGIGFVNSNVKLYSHSFYGNGQVAQLNPNNSYLQPSMRSIIENNTALYANGSGTNPVIPINFGTYIALRRFTKRDRFELNPNIEYDYVLSPVFDGYQPSKISSGGISANGDQSYTLISLALRYKF